MGSKALKYLILLAFVLLIIAISSFWFNTPSFKEGDVVLELEGPTQAVSGEEAVYTLKYANETRSVLHDIDLVFFYPEGAAISKDGKIIEDHSEDFTIDELASGEKGEKEFRAFLIGEKGNIKIAKAIFSFKAGNLNSGFEKSVSLSTTIVSTPIVLTLVAPPNVISGENIQYILDYRNTADEDFSDLTLEFDYPDGFTSREFSSNPDKGNNNWSIKSLKKGSGSRISIGGILDGREGESKVVSVTLKRKISGEYVDYQKTSVATVISSPVLGLEVSVNNTTDYLASLGDRLNYAIKYSNNSNVNFFGMNLVVKFEGDTFDFSSLDTRGGFFDDSTKTITWNSSVVPDFGNFTPGVNGKINFSLPLKLSFPSAIPGSSQDKFVKMSVKFGTDNVPTGFESDGVYISSSLVTKITTQPAFNQAIYYDDPNFGSSGPLPMKVGEETFFTVRWLLTNPGNDVENIKVTTKLPPGVEWADMTWTNNDLPQPVFNPNSFQITWSLPKLPYGSGVFTEKYEGRFRIKIKPTDQQKSSSVQLVDGVQFTGTDSFTKQDIVINKNGITSNDLADRSREGNVQ